MLCLVFQKRRSARNTKRQKYVDDLDLHLTDDDEHKLKEQESDTILKPVMIFTGFVKKNNVKFPVALL